MLQIRQSQMKLFADMARLSFENWMTGHVRKFFANATSRWSDQELREFIGYGTRRAARHGLRSRRAVCKYIDLMVVFGRDFDVDPKYPWAAWAVRDWKTESGKVDALFRAGLREEAKGRRRERS